MQFTRSSRTKWHATISPIAVYTTRDGEYLFFHVNHQTTPLLRVRRSGSVWYVRLTTNFGFVPTVRTIYTTSTTQECSVPLPPFAKDKSTRKTATRPTTSFAFTTFDDAMRAASALVEAHSSNRQLS